MQNLTLEAMPSFIEKMAEKIDRLESLLLEKQPTKVDTSKKKYFLKDAAFYCGMAEPTFRTYIYKRKVAGTKFGKRWLFLEKDLDAFIEDFRRSTSNELAGQAIETLTNR